jgi:hypothetical protein
MGMNAAPAGSFAKQYRRPRGEGSFSRTSPYAPLAPADEGREKPAEPRGHVVGRNGHSGRKPDKGSEEKEHIDLKYCERDYDHHP